jgi:hypothetical protein
MTVMVVKAGVMASWRRFPAVRACASKPPCAGSVLALLGRWTKARSKAKTAGASIAPLCGATLARWGLLEFTPAARPKTPLPLMETSSRRADDDEPVFRELFKIPF